MAEPIPAPANPTLEGVGQALRRAIPVVHDAEEQADRHELRKIEIREAVRR